MGGKRLLILIPRFTPGVCKLRPVIWRVHFITYSHGNSHCYLLHSVSEEFAVILPILNPFIEAFYLFIIYFFKLCKHCQQKSGGLWPLLISPSMKIRLEMPPRA